MNSMQIFQRWKSCVEDDILAAQLRELEQVGNNAIEDAFFQDLEFGTAGLRGILGPGTNRMNIYTVGKATQGFANYLNAQAQTGRPSVAIARDNRNQGEELVQRAASVLAANGIDVYVFPRIEPTPALSFAVRDLGCTGGICMTASHNPAPYNGYKVYDSTGCQITSQMASDISQSIACIDPFEDVQSCNFDDALEAGRIRWIDEDTLDRFLDCVFEAGAQDSAATRVPLTVAYTPLHGTGLEGMQRVFERAKIDYVLVDEQCSPDGNFPTCPYPNPETREALEKGIAYLKTHNCDLVLATDPDADRVGVAVHSGHNVHLLTGNEIGILMLDYLCKTYSQTQSLPEHPVAVSTIVSTAMIDAIAQDYGIEIKRVLTGFKYIGGVITELEQEGHPERFILGFEESYGYLTGSHVRDKDALNAGLVICQMTQAYKQQGMDLYQAMEALYETYGYYANRTINVSFPGADGSRNMKQIMERLRNESPRKFADMDVIEIIDYETGCNGLPPANVIESNLGLGRKVIFRPSGTEPKIKAYLFARADTRQAAESQLDALEAAARNCLA